jgi:hypothetical protein
MALGRDGGKEKGEGLENQCFPLTEILSLSFFVQ